jgi:hypothetical protein
MPFDVQVSRSFHVLTDSESLDRFTSTQFYMSDFIEANNGRSFNDTFKTIWSQQSHTFFVQHLPKLICISFGQNMLIDGGTALLSHLHNDFDLDRVESVQFSIAVNIGFLQSNSDSDIESPDTNFEENPGSQMESQIPTATDHSTDGIRNDPAIGRIYNNFPPGCILSTVLTEKSIENIFGHPAVSAVNVYRKAFNPAFSNFQSKFLPPGVFGDVPDTFTICGIQGYSTVSHLLRRTSKSEPFTSRPFARLLSESHLSQTTVRKYRQIINKDLTNLSQDISALEQNGADYRLECTFEVGGVSISSVESDLESYVSQFQAWAKKTIVEHGVFFSTSIFPRVTRMYTKSIIDEVRQLAERCFQSPSALSIQEKEYAVFLENLVQ